MARGKNIPFSQKEFQAVEVAIAAGHDGLKTLFDKMVKSRLVESQKFKAKDAIRIAEEVLGARLTKNPKMGIAWTGKVNKYIKANELTPSLMRRGCEVAERTWKGNVYFDALLPSILKLVANDTGATTTFGGFAE